MCRWTLGQQLTPNAWIPRLGMLQTIVQERGQLCPGRWSSDAILVFVGSSALQISLIHTIKQSPYSSRQMLVENVCAHTLFCVLIPSNRFSSPSLDDTRLSLDWPIPSSISYMRVLSSLDPPFLLPLFLLRVVFSIFCSRARPPGFPPSFLLNKPPVTRFPSFFVLVNSRSLSSSDSSRSWSSSSVSSSAGPSYSSEEGSYSVSSSALVGDSGSGARGGMTTRRGVDMVHTRNERVCFCRRSSHRR